MWKQCGESLKDRLQTLQNRAAQTIARVRYAEADHDTLLANFGWLNVGRLIKLDLGVFVYKELLSLHPERDESLFQELDNFHKNRPATSNSLFIPGGDTKFSKAMSYSGNRLWNEIPAEIKRSQTLDTFKDKFKQHLAAQQALAL